MKDPLLFFHPINYHVLSYLGLKLKTILPKESHTQAKYSGIGPQNIVYEIKIVMTVLESSC